jgi:hypothetical protein
VFILLGSLAILVAIGVGYVLASRAATADRVNPANAVLDNVDQHYVDFKAKVDAAIAGVGTLNGANFDPAKAKTGIDQTNALMDAVKASDMADIVKVKAADGKVQDRSPFTALSSDLLDTAHRHLDAYHRALVAEMGEVDIVKQQLKIVSDVMTTLVQLQPLTADLNATNIAAGLRDYAAPSATLDKVIADAASATDTPAKLREFLTLFRSELTHTKAVLDAAQSGSIAQIQAAQAALQVDLDALDKFDSAAMQKQYEDLATRLDAKVNAELAKAK